ncbi:MAG TPA: T9SS type A sorting domain-containing protein [Bacteroidetes bacterium]|nr:T9SS type A sorting domain-containing protein [Bacteroidota bacterium]
MKIFTTFLITFLVSFSLMGQEVLFEDNFDDGIGSTRWDVGDVGGTNVSNLAFDYVGAGIPAAPNGGGLGLKMEVNTVEPGEFSQMAAFPKGKEFKGEFVFKFDVWLNYDPDGSGTTEFAFFGAKKQNTNLPSDSGVDFAFTGDNGSGDDIRFYVDGAEIKFEDDSTLWAGPMQNGNDDNGPVYPYSESYTGSTPGNQWLTVEVKVFSDSIFFDVNGTTWMHVANTQPDGNVMIGYMDIFSSVDPNGTQFGVYDNVSVTKLTNNVVDFNEINASIYPNPAVNTLNIDVEENSTFELVNSFGQVVHKSQVNGSSKIDVSNLSKGWYVARLITNSGDVAIKKVIIQ